MEKKYKRRNYYIDKSFQNNFFSKFSSVIFLNMALIIAMVWFLGRNASSLLPGEASNLSSIDFSKQKNLKEVKPGVFEVDANGSFILLEKKPEQYNAFQLYIIPILVVSLLNLIVFLIFNLFFSHKMAGPVYKMKRIIRQYLDSGKTEKIVLRKNDHFKDLAEDINQLIEKKSSK